MRVLPRLCAVLLVAGIAPARGQSSTSGAQTSELLPGARVRIEAPGVVAGRHTATLLSRSADTITVGGPGMVPLAIPVARISSLQLSRGKSRSMGAIRGIAWGAPIGAVFGALTLSGLHDCRNCDPQSQPTDLEWVAFNAVAGALWGAGIGALIGRERWEPFDLSRRTALRLQPSAQPSRVALSVRVDF